MLRSSISRLGNLFIHKLFVAAVGAALFSSFAHGIKIGQASVASYLHEPLVCQIPVEGIEPDELAGFDINIAHQDEYLRLKLEKPRCLSNVQKEFTTAAQGKYQVVFRTRANVDELFVPFLVKVKHQSGQFFKLYKLLLNPKDIKPETLAVSNEPGSKSDKKKNDTKSVTQPRDSSTQYWAVQYAQTLWSIAKQFTRDQDTSLRQMVMALFELNPWAFKDKNINGLKAGSKLKIPTQQEIKQISKKQAKQAIDQHVSEWSQRDRKKSTRTREKVSLKQKQTVVKIVRSERFSAPDTMMNIISQVQSMENAMVYAVAHRSLKKNSNLKDNQPIVKIIQSERFSAPDPIMNILNQVQKMHDAMVYALSHRSLKKKHIEFSPVKADIPAKTRLSELVKEKAHQNKPLLRSYQLLKDDSAHISDNQDFELQSKSIELELEEFWLERSLASIQPESLTLMQENSKSYFDVITINPYALIILVVGVLLVFLMLSWVVAKKIIQSKIHALLPRHMNAYPRDLKHLMDNMTENYHHKDILLLLKHEMKYHKDTQGFPLFLLTLCEKMGLHHQITDAMSSVLEKEIQKKEDTLSDMVAVDGDSVAARLNLATTYVSMGQYKLAHELIEGVLEKGNERERQDAKALLAQLKASHELS